jgi:signal transduction histidine kinase
VDIGRETVFTSIIFLIIALSLLILAIWVLLEKHVLLPLGQLKNHMHKMQLDEDLTQHIAITTTDEFGDIGRELNELITTLNNSRKDSEAARNTAIAASKSKSDFLATMSHEIRTPMNGVLGMADLLLASKPLSDEQEQWVRTINHSGNALLKILNDILDFSKIEAGKFILEDTSFNFGKMLEDSAELLAYDIQSKGLELLVDFSPSLFCDFMGDAGRLRQIILNLLSNASKFTTAGSIRLCASEISVEGENYIRIEVQDTGIGIQDGNQEHLFNSFTQEDASTTRKFGGTGLGLAVTKQLTELMGGNVGFSSSYGKGSTFWVQIPLKATSDLTAIKQNEFKGSLAIVYILDQAVTEIMISRLQYRGVCVRVITAPGEIVQIAKHIAKPGLVGKPQFFIDAKLLSVVVCKELSLLRGALSGAAFKLVFLNPLALHFSAQSLQSLGGNSLLPTPVKIGALAFYFLPPD